MQVSSSRRNTGCADGAEFGRDREECENEDMIAAQELECVPIFACLDETERRRLAERAADMRLEPGEWLIREGEIPYFFALLDGELKLQKDLFGQARELTRYKAGEFFGEVPILLAAPSFASVQAVTQARVARFDGQQLMELIQSSTTCSAVILQTMTDRLSKVQQYAKETPTARVLLVGTQYDVDCSEIRRFLSANRIPYEWVDAERDADRVPTCMAKYDGPSVVVDRQYCVENPTVRSVAQALGIRTSPRFDTYDVVICGAGPAGMAAGVYGASEGLKVLMVEKSAAGGQAGTSSRIENYLGFPNGISGDDLSERALKQAERFGAEIAMTREIESIEALADGKYCIQMDGGTRVSSCVVVLATGVEWRLLKAEGVSRLQGRGVLYGASRNESGNVVGKKVFLVGGGNSAGQAAVFFANYAEEVTILVRGEGLVLTMSQYLITQIASKKNIRVEPYTEVMEALGEDHLEQIVTRTRVPGEDECTQTRDADALFVMIGADASTAWMPKGLDRDAKGYVPFPLETSLPGVFCAGDVRHNSIKRVSSGVGEGSMAIAFVHQYLALQDF
jgi:thioredoxin reductase (NADPH)